MKRFAQIFLIALVTGCADKAPTHTLRFFEQSVGGLPESHSQPVTIRNTGQQLFIDPVAMLTERDVYLAAVQNTPAGAAVLVRFDAHGANMLAEMTTRLRGQSMVIMINNRPVAAVLVDRPNVTGQFTLLGDFTDAEAQALVDSLNKTANRSRDIGDTKLAP